MRVRYRLREKKQTFDYLKMCTLTLLQRFRLINVNYAPCRMFSVKNYAPCRMFSVKIDEISNFSNDSSNSPEGEIYTNKMGSVTAIHINRSEKRNCFNYSTAVKFKQALDSFNNDETSNIGIIYGEGGNFCSGLDLEELANDSKFYKRFLDLNLMGEFSKKPLIAAVTGYAVGAGFDLALWCDLRVVEDTAVFAYLNRRFGVPVPDTCARRLVTMVGSARAIDWVVTGRLVRSKEAFSAGIVSRLVACGTAYGQALNLAKTIVKCPESAIEWDRINLQANYFPLEEQKHLLEQKLKLQTSIEKESMAGAERFMAGIGRHARTTNLK